MSDYTDYMEEMFFNHTFNVRETISSNQRWIDDYLDKRSKYPEWVTRDGTHIKVGDITDNHLENLLNYLPKDTVWHNVFSCEKLYRKLSKQIVELRKEDNYNTEIINKIY